METVLLHGGKVWDGSGKPAFPADVLVDGNRIVEVWPHAPPGFRATRRIDISTHTVILTLEGLGIAGVGEAGDWVQDPDTMTIGSSLPVNTHGGLLSEGYLMGLSHVAEAVLQLRGECGDRQVEDAERALVTAGAMMQGSMAVLARG